MKNKKGFTLVEIIVCIGLIVLIGTSSIVGFKVISNKKTITKLNQITDKAIEAAQVYIETNDTAYNQLYNNKNGVNLPLQLLVNEGLLNLDGTDLTEKDIKNHYVATFLGGTNSSENCEQMENITSWGSDKAIYFCMNSDGSSNLATIDPTKYGNKTYVSNEPYYYQGYADNNYVGSINNFSCSSVDFSNGRIYAIDMDDTIIVAMKTNITNKCTYDGGTYTINSSTLDKNNVKRTGICTKTKDSTNSGYSTTSYSSCDLYESWIGTTDALTYKYSFRLPNTCKITSGTGMSNNPFEITC